MTYSSILNNFATYSALQSSYASYSSLAGAGMFSSTFGEYDLQMFKYQPLAYWYVIESNLAAIEPSIYGSNAEIEKIAGTDGYTPIVYSSDPGTNILFEEDYLLLPAVEFNKINIAKNTYSKQPFSINFWYKNLNNVIDQDIPILRIGTAGNYKIDLHTKNGLFMLVFLGQKVYVEVDDYRDIFNITVSFDGERASLIVNGVVGKSISEINDTFNAAPFILWQAGIGCQVIFQKIAMFGYAMSQIQAEYLYRLGSSGPNNLELGYTNIDAYTLNYDIPQVHRTVEYTINDSNALFRNCVINNGVITLYPKKSAVINGATFLTSSYTFSGSNNISLNISESDMDLSNTSIKINSNIAASSGTLMYIDASIALELYIESGNLKLKSEGSSTPIYSEAIGGTGSYVAIEFIDREIWVNRSGTKTNTGMIVPSIIKSIIVGNNIAGNNAYSGSITKFNINYVNNPLQVGIYNLDLTQPYTNYIKPTHDAVVISQLYLPAGTTGNYIEYKSSGGVEVMKFTSSNTVDEYYSCDNGITLLNNDQVQSLPISSDTPVLIAVRLYDEVTSSDPTEITIPKLSDLMVKGYSDKTLVVKEIDAETTSVSDYPYNASSEYIRGIFAKDDFAINNSNYQFSSIFIRINAHSVPSSKTIISATGGTTITLNKINNNSYTLTSNNGSTIRVNGQSYLSGNASQTLYINDDAFIVLSLASAQNLGLTFSMAGFEISDLAISNASGPYFTFFTQKASQYSFSSNRDNVSDASTISLTDTVNVKAFAANIVLSS